MLDIRKIEIADEKEPFIEVSTETDFQYSIRIHDRCEVITNHGCHIKGELSYVGDDCLKIRTEDIEGITVMYSSIVEIIEEDGLRIY